MLICFYVFGYLTQNSSGRKINMSAIVIFCFFSEKKLSCCLQTLGAVCCSLDSHSDKKVPVVDATQYEWINCSIFAHVISVNSTVQM
jgi:hypothetical protein